MSPRALLSPSLIRSLLVCRSPSRTPRHSVCADGRELVAARAQVPAAWLL